MHMCVLLYSVCMRVYEKATFAMSRSNIPSGVCSQGLCNAAARVINI